MSTPDRRRRVASTIGVVLLGIASSAAIRADDTPRLGQPIDEALRATQPRTVWPDGRGLPPGEGSVAEGRQVYIARCRHCHGDEGRGGSGGHLIGEGSLAGPEQDPAVNTYWPYATTLWDWIHRAMPMDAPGSLSADETYAVTAYLLHLGGLIAADARLDAGRLAAIQMPNRDGFDAVDGPAAAR